MCHLIGSSFNKSVALFCIGLALFLSCTAFAAGVASKDVRSDQINKGQKLAQTCAACHGLDGNTTNPLLYPNIAGQLPDYIILQLTNFKSGERPNAMMKSFASTLQKSDMQDIAVYYGSLRPKAQASTDKALEEKGKDVFMKGSAEGAPACVSCHGTKGQGQAVFPRVASQPAVYTLEQLHVYRDAPKFNNPLATQMKSVAVKLTEQEMRAVSAFLATVE